MYVSLSRIPMYEYILIINCWFLPNRQRILQIIYQDRLIYLKFKSNSKIIFINWPCVRMITFYIKNIFQPNVKLKFFSKIAVYHCLEGYILKCYSVNFFYTKSKTLKLSFKIQFNLLLSFNTSEIFLISKSIIDYFSIQRLLYIKLLKKVSIQNTCTMRSEKLTKTSQTIRVSCIERRIRKYLPWTSFSGLEYSNHS